VRVSPGLKHLPATFGKNQLLPVSNDTRALLESIVARFEAPIRYAFAYGSGVFEQDGYTGTKTIPGVSARSAPSLVGKGSETGGSVAFEQRPMVDFMFAVTHAAHFHSINMQQFPSHYPLHSRLLGSSYVSKMQEFGPGVWFNAYIPMNGAVRIFLYFYSQSDIL
jgi:translocator assembly and maintenance protein 41